MATNYKDDEKKKTEQQKLNGVDDATMNKMNSSFTASTQQQNAQNKANQGLSKVESLTSKDSIVSSNVMNTLNSSFKKPTSVLQADSYISTQLQKIQSGKTSFSDQVKDMMSQIQNRDKFSYDVDSDPLFQQALASSMASGKQAMQDTIGQASALTGGYGSTYATTAGNQAYNSFIEDAYNNLPQYYQMAMEAYQMEGDELYRQLDMLNSADDKEYNRNVTAYDATYQHRNRMYDEAYQLHRDAKTDAYNMANLELNIHGQQVSDAMNYYNASSNYADTLYGREFDNWQSEVDQAFKYADMLNNEYWSDKNFNEGVRQYEQNYAEDVRQYNTSLAEQQRQHDDDMQYKKDSLAQDQAQFNAGLDLNGDGSISAEEKAAYAQGKVSNSGDGSGGLSTAEFNVAKNAWKEAGGGDAGLTSAVRSLEAMGIVIDDEIMASLEGALVEETETPTKTGVVKNFKTDKNDNFDIEIDGESYRVENHGKVSDKAKTVLDKLNVKNGKAFIYDGKMYVKSGDNYYNVGATNILWKETGGYKNAFGKLNG